jgi:hypothetical protein
MRRTTKASCSILPKHPWKKPNQQKDKIDEAIEAADE